MCLGHPVTHAGSLIYDSIMTDEHCLLKIIIIIIIIIINRLPGSMDT